jgi:hypothetical protein
MQWSTTYLLLLLLLLWHPLRPLLGLLLWLPAASCGYVPWRQHLAEWDLRVLLEERVLQQL